MSEREQDRKFSQAVIKRDRGICRYALPGCRRAATEVSHIYTRSYRKIRWNMLNGLAACRSCHNKIENNIQLADRVHQSILGREWEVLQRLKEEAYNGKS